LLKGSFVPDRPQRELRELVRYRKSLISDRTREVNRVQKVLEGANIKLKGTGASDVMGVSARAMIEAIIAGETDPDVIASHVKTHLKASPEDIKRAVDGLVGPHQRVLLQAQLKHIDHLNEQIAEIDAVVKERMAPFVSQVEALDTLPGIGTVGAQEIIASIGVDMTRFPTANHLASWASLCPGMNESGGQAQVGKYGQRRRPADDPSPSGLGSGTGQTELLPKPVLLSTRQARSEEGHRGCGSQHVGRDLLHPSPRNDL
jgi:transposase